MNSKFKKLVLIMLIGVMLFSCFNVSYADTKNNKLPKPIWKMVLVQNGVPREITFDELKRIYPMNVISKHIHANDGIGFKNSIIENTPISPMSITFYKYIEIEGEDDLNYDMAKPVTPWINGSRNGARISYGQSESYTSTFSVGLTSSKINAILQEIGASYAKSASSSASFGMEFDIAPYETARVIFAPTTRETEGILQTWQQLEDELNPRLISEEPSSGIVVRKVGKFADGLYYLEYM